ncbi:MAG: hypothetical protein AAFQ64_01740 [Pseudomonadota bacterium]
MRLPSCLLTLVITATAATAQANPWTCNDNGAAYQQSDGKTLYLGKSCDAARSDGKAGRWWYAASAFIVDFPGETSTRFPFEIPCDTVPYCKPPGL